MHGINRRIRKATSTRRGKIIFFSVLTLFVAAAAGGVLYWQFNKKRIIRQKLESAIREKTKGLYKIEYDKLNLDEVNGSLSVTHMRLHYDSLRYRSLSKEGNAPAILFNIDIPELVIEGVKTPRALINNEIVGRKLEIKNSSIDIFYTQEGQDSLRNLPADELYEVILGNLHQISLDTVEISGADIRSNNLKTKRQRIDMAGTLIRLVDLRIDSTGNADASRLLFAKKIEVNCERLTWKSRDNLYKYEADNVSLNSEDRSLRTKQFAVIPQLSEEEFVRSVSTQVDRFDFSLNDIIVNDINFQQLLDERLTAGNTTIGSGSFKVYRDLNIQRDKKNRVGSYPHQAIMNVPFLFDIKKLTLKSAFVEYKERSISTKRLGKIQFMNTSAVISNLTNEKSAIARNNIMNVDIVTRFLDKAPFNVSWTFYLGNSRGRFNVKGNLGGIDAKALNLLTEPMGPARIEDGVINGLYFDFAGHDYGMDGTVKLLYDNLKITVLEKDEDSKKLNKKALASLMANIIAKNSNPSGKNDPRIEKVHFDRDANRSIFHLAWKTLFTGVKETVGLNKVKS